MIMMIISGLHFAVDPLHLLWGSLHLCSVFKNIPDLANCYKGVFLPQGKNSVMYYSCFCDLLGFLVFELTSAFFLLPNRWFGHT